MSRATQENIKRLLSITGATHQQVADIAGVDRSAVSHWKSGKAEPRMGHLQKIADYYGISTANLADPDGMKYVHKGVDGRLHDNSEARVDDLKELVSNLSASSDSSDMLRARVYARHVPRTSPRLTKSEIELLDMFRNLNKDGEQTILTVLAALVKSGMFGRQ